MTRVLPTIAAVLLLAAAAAPAKIPDPDRSGFAVTGRGASCQFRFRADGGLDCMTVCVTLRDAFDLPVESCSTSVRLEPNVETEAFCSCGSSAVGGFTDADGVFRAEFEALGGRGSLDVVVAHYCYGPIEITRIPIAFTGPDLNGDCAPVDVVSLGVWAGCLPPSPYCPASDYNCDSTIDVLDLAVWAGGIGVECISP